MAALRSAAPLAACLGALAIASCARAPRPEPAPEPPPEGTPRLVLFVTVDQLRADYLERFRPLFAHGLDRLLREAVVFSDAHHDHAQTSTAPGHATLATGVHPSRHGIVANYWFDRDAGEEVASDEDDRWDEDHSPHRLLVDTLADRIKARWPQSKAFGASGKSRGAILPVGRSADRAFWYDDESGRFVTSTYYGEAEPPWLAEVHRTALPDRMFGTPWEALPETAAAVASGDHGVVPLARGLGHEQLPRAIGRASVHPDESYYEDFYRTPFLDRYLLELGRVLLIEEGLGADPYPDLLALSFSALDLAGHDWGPDSPEVLDTLLRLDRVLGELLDLVDREVGLEHTLVSLSADHGVVPVPEIAAGRGGNGRRFGLGELRCVQLLAGKLDRELGVEPGSVHWFRHDLVFDREAIDAAGLSLTEAAAAARRLLESCPGVERVWTAAELGDGAGDLDSIGRRFRNNFHAERSPDLSIQFEAGSIARSSSSATHGSPYDYDTRVPWLLRLPGGLGQSVDVPVRTVDVAPTLAALLGVDLGSQVDGVDRSTGLLSAGD